MPAPELAAVSSVALPHSAWALGALMGTTIAPAACGAALTGWLHRRWPDRKELWAVALLLGPSLLYIVSTALIDELVLGLWDGLAVCGWVAVGGGLTKLVLGRRDGGRRALLLAGSTIAWLALVELALIAVGTPLATVSGPVQEEQALVPRRTADTARVRYGAMGRGWDHYACGVLFDDDEWAQRVQEATGLAGESAPRVLHLGDSMTYGLGVSSARRFTTLLSARTGAAHVNAAVPAMAPDFHVAVAEQRLAQARPQTVVLHLFTDNDVHELGAPMGCCGGRPLLDLDVAPPTRNCTTRRDAPVLANFASWLARHSPPPWPIRALAPNLRLAAVSKRAFARASHAFAPEGDVPMQQATKLIGVLARKFVAIAKKHGASPVIVLHPSRRELDEDPRRPEHHLDLRLARALRGSGAQVIDLWPTFQAALRSRKGRESGLFLNHEPTDPHYSPAGHQLVAEALKGALRP